MAQAGFGLAFCIGAVMCSVLGATTMATGELQPLPHMQFVNDVIVYIVAYTDQAVKEKPLPPEGRLVLVPAA